MLLTNWSGGTTWFGNYKYPRGVGNGHMSANPTYFEQWRFLCIRNPVSNFGKFVLGTKPEWTWPWYYNIHLFGRYYTKFGWKTAAEGGKRTFVFRPIWRD